MSVRSFLHVKLDVRDLDRSLAFYRGLLGFSEIVRYDRADGVTIVQVSPTGRPPGIELWREAGFGGPASAAENPLGERLHVALGVSDVPAVVARLRAAGVAVEREPFRIGHETIAFVRDPDGWLLELNDDGGGPA